MITAYSRGTIWWPRWRQFMKVLRWLIPIVLLMREYSFIDLIAPGKMNAVVPDVVMIIFTMTSSFVFLYFVNLIPEKYRPASRYLNGFLEIVLQMLFVDLSIRFYFIPLEYAVNRICETGKLKNFYVNSLKSEEAFQWLRLIIGIIQLGIGIYLSGFYLSLLQICYRTKSILSFWCAPQVVTEQRSRSRSQGRKSCEMRTRGFETVWRYPPEASVNY